MVKITFQCPWQFVHQRNQVALPSSGHHMVPDWPVKMLKEKKIHISDKCRSWSFNIWFNHVFTFINISRDPANINAF